MTRIKELKDIEPTLGKLYKEKGDPCRASLFNFVIWAPTEERAIYLRSLTDKVADRFPCRMLFITQSDRINDLEVDVSVHFMGSTACDLIEIKVPHKEVEFLSYFVLPHLLPDLSLYLLWGQDPTIKGPLFETLYPYAKRILFDSEYLECLSDFASNIKKHPDAKLRDVNWTLISGWRSLFLKLFDTYEKEEQVKNALKVTICCKELVSSQALLFKAWLTDHFGTNSSVFELKTSGGDGLKGDLASVKLDVPDLFSYSVERKQNKGLVHICHDDICDLPTLNSLTHSQRGFHFWREILFEGDQAEYLKLLKSLETSKVYEKN